MECLRCKQNMEIVRQDDSRDRDTGKRYDRVLYRCVSDDVWIKVETPKAQAA